MTAAALVLELLQAHPEGLTVKELRDAFVEELERGFDELWELGVLVHRLPDQGPPCRVACKEGVLARPVTVEQLCRRLRVHGGWSAQLARVIAAWSREPRVLAVRTRPEQLALALDAEVATEQLDAEVATKQLDAEVATEQLDAEVAPEQLDAEQTDDKADDHDLYPAGPWFSTPAPGPKPALHVAAPEHQAALDVHTQAEQRHDSVRHATCPKCGAAPGKRCRNTKTRKLRRLPHVERQAIEGAVAP